MRTWSFASTPSTLPSSAHRTSHVGRRGVGSGTHGPRRCGHALEQRRAVGTGDVVLLERCCFCRVERSHKVCLGDFARIGWTGAYELHALVLWACVPKGHWKLGTTQVSGRNR